jgi:hypothetical protein
MVKAPPKSGVFAWTAALGKILTLDNLQKRNIVVMEWCYMCKQCGKSIDHLFLHCEVPTELWTMFLQLFGVIWVMPRKVSDCLGNWRGQVGNRLAMRIRRMIPLCVMWCLWRERNARSFEDRESGLLELKKLALHTLFSWRVTWSHLHVYTYFDFLRVMCFIFYLVGVPIVYFMCT